MEILVSDSRSKSLRLPQQRVALIEQLLRLETDSVGGRRLDDGRGEKLLDANDCVLNPFGDLNW